MPEEKEPVRKKKGFYLSVCTAMICMLAIGTIYYKMNYTKSDNDGNLFVENQTEEQSTKEPVRKKSEIADKITQNKKDDAHKKDIKKTEVATNENNNENSQNDANIKRTMDIKTNDIDLENKKPKEEIAKKDKEEDEENNSVAVMSGANGKHTFNEEKGLVWPVNGDVILKYSMNNTVYFKTLAQYKCNPAIAIAAKKGTSVKSGADGTVTKVGSNAEIGKYVTIDIGSNYSVTYGQLDNIIVKNGQEVKESELLGKVAKPTKYYVKEGSNLYLQVKQNGNTVDPLLILR